MMRLVLDTNVLVSRLIRPQSELAEAIRFVMANHEILQSKETLDELIAVLSRGKFDKWVSLDARHDFIQEIEEAALLVPVKKAVRLCADPDDDKFLALALEGRADYLVTGDRALLGLAKFAETEIIAPVALRERLG